MQVRRGKMARTTLLCFGLYRARREKSKPHPCVDFQWTVNPLMNNCGHTCPEMRPIRLFLFFLKRYKNGRVDRMMKRPSSHAFFESPYFTELWSLFSSYHFELLRRKGIDIFKEYSTVLKYFYHKMISLQLPIPLWGRQEKYYCAHFKDYETLDPMLRKFCHSHQPPGNKFCLLFFIFLPNHILLKASRKYIRIYIKKGLIFDVLVFIVDLINYLRLC